MMSDIIVTFAIACVTAGPAYLKIFADARKKETNEEKAMRLAVAAQIKQSLTKTMIDACERGYTFQEEWDSIETMYEPYHMLGWNGKLDNLHDRYNNLELKEK